MSLLKRILLFFFCLCGLIIICCIVPYELGYTWPVAGFMLRFMSEDIMWRIMTGYFMVLAGLLAIGLLVSLFARKRVTRVEIATVDGGTITVASDAIASAVRHLAEASGQLRAKRIKVQAKTHGPVRVKLELVPLTAINVAEVGPKLTSEIIAELSNVIGSMPRAVDIEFTRFAPGDPQEEELQGVVNTEQNSSEVDESTGQDIIVSLNGTGKVNNTEDTNGAN